MYTRQPPPDTRSARLLEDRIGRALVQTLPIPLAPNASVDHETILRLAIDANRIDRTITSALDLLAYHDSAPCDTDTIFYHLNKLTEAPVMTWFRQNNDHILHHIKARGGLRTAGWAAIDEKRRSFYGRPDLFTTAGEKKNGTHNAYGLVTSESVLPRRRCTFAVEPRHAVEAFTRPFEKVLRRTQATTNIRGYLIDRGFFSAETLRILRENQARFLLGAPATKRIRGLWWTHHRDAVLIRNDHEVTEHLLVIEGHEVKANKREREITTLIVVHRHENGKTRLNAWVTNVTTDPKAAAGLVETYRKRWGIETGYRSKNEAKAFTTTTNPFVRLFLFLLPFLLYNWWRLTDWAQRDRGLWQDKPELMFYVFRYLLRWSPLASGVCGLAQ